MDAETEKQLAAIAKEREQLISQRKKLGKKQAKLSAEIDRLWRREDALVEKERAVRLSTLVGGQVRLRYRQPAGERCAHLNDKVGTLVAVRRTRCTVDFGDGERCGRWNWPLSEIMPADEELQGAIINLGA
jgi:hypothetical protein